MKKLFPIALCSVICLGLSGQSYAADDAAAQTHSQQAAAAADNNLDNDAQALPENSDSGIDSPWMTGPLLAPAGHTLPKNHTNIEPYLFYTDSFGRFDNRWKVQNNKDFDTLSPTLVITQGLADRVDIQAIVPYDWNHTDGEDNSDVGDVAFTLGYQAIEGLVNSWRPDLRVTVTETFPTGAYENLDASKKGTDATGAGSYQTSFGLNFQEMWNVLSGHYLRGRLSLSDTVPAVSHLDGLNAFGGTDASTGKMSLGNKFSADLGMEYTLTQHWVPAFDVLYTYGDGSNFSGTPGVTTSGAPAMTSLPSQSEVSVAPAMEYNFTSTLGMIAGVWVAVDGRNSSDFVSGVVALNYYH